MNGPVRAWTCNAAQVIDTLQTFAVCKNANRLENSRRLFPWVALGYLA